MCCASLYYAGKTLLKTGGAAAATKSAANVAGVYAQHGGEVSFARSWLQIIRQRNFVVFVATNFLQIFDVTVASAFFVIFERHLLGASALSTEVRGIIQVISPRPVQRSMLYSCRWPPHWISVTEINNA